MVGFTLYNNALYLPTADIGDVSQARIGFLFQDAARADPGFELNQQSWTDPTQQGLFFFFPPSAKRDWASFASQVRALFGANKGAQFAWVTETVSGTSTRVSATTLIFVNNQGTQPPSPQQAFSFAFATNITLTVNASAFSPCIIRFDDALGQFLFTGQNATTVALTAQPPGGAPQTFPSTSPTLALSMNGGDDPNGGSVNASFALSTDDLAAFEAGLMYFDAGAAGMLGAFRFPVLRAPGGTATALRFSAWLDVLAPLDATRSYLRCDDPLLGSYFSTANGKAITLTPSGRAQVATAARLVFANRPVHATSDTSTYYLTLAGAFTLGLDDGDSAASTSMLCGTAGTEFLSVSVAPEGADTLVFSPGNPAFQAAAPSAVRGAQPQFLESAGGQVTTAWVQLQTHAGGYVSQPQDSPLYQQPVSSGSRAGGVGAAFDVPLLDFLPLQSWSAVHAERLSGAAIQSSPLVPLVPFAGLSFATATEAAPFLAMEATALNPTRRNLFARAGATASASRRAAGVAMSFAAQDDLTYAMTPQALLAGLSGTGADQLWETTRIAISPSLDGDSSIYLQFTQMADQIRAALQQNQIFLVISTLTDPDAPENALFGFSGTDQQVNIAGWPFSLSPEGTAASDGTPPILILKFYPGQSVQDLVEDTSLWSQPDTFNGSSFTAAQAQTYIANQIEAAAAAVAEDGTASIYYNFYQIVTDPTWSGLLALNANMQLSNLPTAIKAVTGGMTYPGADGKPVSNIDAFRVHHVGVSISDTDPGQQAPTLSQSSFFGLVDYEKPVPSTEARLAAAGFDVLYNFEVEYLRALFTNSALDSFSCQVNLTINNLFGTDVTGEPARSANAGAAADDDNVIVITGSYQAHSTSGDADSAGEGVYSFVSEAPFNYTFGTNPYLDTITLNKVQFSFLQETEQQGSETSKIQASFGISGSMVFKKFDFLDIFAFKELVFNDLGIGVSFDLTVPATGAPTTANTHLTFDPGNLRLDLAATEPREGSTSMLRLLPFKLSSFLYNQYPDKQTVEDLGYFSLSEVPLGSDLSLVSTFTYGLAFDLDLGGLGGLVGSLEAFKFGFLVGWGVDNRSQKGGIAFGVQIPQADGKLQIKIEGVLDLLIEQFVLRYEKPATGEPFLVLALHKSSLTVMGVRLPPGEAQIDVALFAPMDDAARIGWIAAYNNIAPPSPEASPALRAPAAALHADPAPAPPQGSTPFNAPLFAAADSPADATLIAAHDRGTAPAAGPGSASAPPSRTVLTPDAPAPSAASTSTTGAVLLPPLRATDEEEESSVFDLVYLGIGQRVGPSKDDTPTTFADFMTFMTTDFWDAIETREYDKVYQREGQWLALTNFKLLDLIEVGFVFYDTTPFYSLTLNVEKLFNFEITYTKISDSIGLFYAEFSLPDSLRTYEVGAASLTLPSIGVSVYTNGNWKLDVGFPKGDDWSKSFRVEAMAGPVPVTGSGGFYLASLSSATTDVFQADYASILAFGFAARLGVGKDFTAGPLKAGVSVTFFGIIQGAAGYHVAASDEIFKKPDALALSGQFGVIGELYGAIDFVIIKASVNVRLQASIGIVLKYEPAAGNDGSILLYLDASVSVSVSVEIGLGFFSITISFSFDASFRFDWQLAGPSQNAARLAHHRSLRAGRLAMLTTTGISTLPLIPVFSTALPIWFTPEGTAVFADSVKTGVPWVVTSLALQFDPAPKRGTTYADFLPFEKLTTQLVTWAIGQATGKGGWDYAIDYATLSGLDENPDVLLAGIDYALLLEQLAVFTAATLIVPSEPAGTTVSAATFPMFPFVGLQTTGRQVNGAAADLDYVFASKNIVSADYIAWLDAYFNQLFVNQSGGDGAARLSAAQAEDAATPLVQEIFCDYLTGLIRGGVHQLLETMQNGQMTNATIDKLVVESVQAGLFASLAGQMSSAFRGGTQLPYTAGLTVPDGPANAVANPLYALLWQEFPVGDVASGGQYSIALSNPAGSGQAWLSVTADWKLTSDWLLPLQGIERNAIIAPSAPVQLPFTDVAPQSFAFNNAIVWTQPSGTATSLRPFPSSLQTLQTQQGTAINMLVESRTGGAPYLPGGTTLPPGSFAWATQISLTVAQAVGTDGKILPDVFQLNGASEQDEQLLEQIIAAITTEGLRPTIQILYQTAAGASGLTSNALDPTDVFVLRTNSTTVSAPPTRVAMAYGAPPPSAPVGAHINEAEPFLKIVQQAVVTNATGYYLRYRDSSGDSLPPTLFSAGPAPLTILLTYPSDGTGNTKASPASIRPFYNAITLENADPSLIYYAETTDAALNTQHATVAAGSIGVLLTRDDAAMLVAPSAKLAALTAMDHRQRYRRSDLVRALVGSGIEDEADLHAILATAGSGTAQLNALYSLVTYRVEGTSGFVQSNFSAPLQPQRPDPASSAADGLTDRSDGTRSYRAYVPLYALAVDNQPLQPIPNRYASIGAPVRIDFFQNDAFGNQLPGAQSFAAINGYFDPIVPLDQWQGLVSTYDFNTSSGPQASHLTVYLQLSAAAFAGLSADQRASALQSWTTILDQITGPGIGFTIEANLALQADGSMAEVALDTSQTAAVVSLVEAIVAWLQNPTGSFPADRVPLTVAVQGPGTIPPTFEMFVLLSIARDPALISPLLKDDAGVITFPSAQRASTTIAATVGGSQADGTSVSINAFASQFVQAFPALALAVGLGGAHESINTSKRTRQASRLRDMGVPADSGGSGQSTAQSLWAVQKVLLDISVGTGPQAGPYYASPMPLDNTLNSAVVPLPTMPEGLPALPASQLFTDVDLDAYNSGFFAAVDLMLTPALAAAMFEKAPAAYTTIANGRSRLAELYASKEIDWLFDPNAPFTGPVEQLWIARDAFGEQMRAALATAYTTDTIVQYGVSWTNAPPAAVDGMYELFGTVRPIAGGPLPKGCTISAPHVPIVSSGASTLTFLFGLDDVRHAASVSLDLVYEVTHLQHFLEPASATPPGEARPSIWLQLIDTATPPHIGPANMSTVIPLVLREYPIPPTLIRQAAQAGGGSGQAGATNPLVAAAAWTLAYAYQAQLTPHDQIVTAITYNSDLSVTNGAAAAVKSGPDGAVVRYTLFESLARFRAAYALLQSVLPMPENPSWVGAVQCFADLVDAVVHNTTWTPDPALLGRTGDLLRITDSYGVEDVAIGGGSNRTVTISWTDAESSFAGATVSIEALDPTSLAPYPDQTQQRTAQSVIDTYTPQPPLADDWIVHQIGVQGLNVLAAENALASVQVERNLLTMEAGGKPWSAKTAFVYMTPVVSATQPITPFVDYAVPINVAQLPSAGTCSACTQTTPAGTQSLCQYVYTILSDLLANEVSGAVLGDARRSAGLGAAATRRMKIACSFQYAVASAAGVSSANPVAPLVPVVLAPSFLIDGSDPAQLGGFAAHFAESITAWTSANGLVFGPAAQPGARLVFDLTLFAELSGSNLPVLRLRTLQLSMADVTP
ncbi:hypothetical protein [uncultured Sphingomonas sp.]|uniref:hypothetical protein n=1 Tax=uncultured Sphingomonas sp. TaxID=158754 RepID=UPI0025F7C45A|nr:hypothetical protein [uncultured Sphingomonas sp.]